MLISCLLLAWLAWLSRVIGDIFRPRDLSGWGATAWVVVAVLLPFLGVLACMASRRDGMTEWSMARTAAKELAKAEFLLDIGSITQVEFDTVKQTASNARLA